MATSSSPPDSADPRRALIQRLEALRSAGVTSIRSVSSAPPPAVNGRPETAAVLPPRPAVEPAPAVDSSPTQEPPPMAKRAAAIAAPAPLVAGASLIPLPFPSGLPASAQGREALLAELRQTVAGCTLCSELAKTRTQTVFGAGNPKPRVVFFGEAPGENEDKQGEPFVGRAGKLLTDIIKACTWEREDVFILNVIKCRPPSNRTPLPDEVTRCRPYFERQLEILRPEYIVCLGSVAAQALLETNVTIGKLRGRFHDYRGAKAVATYHPAYLLRNPDAKKFVWEDMQMLMREMGVTIPGKK